MREIYRRGRRQHLLTSQLLLLPLLASSSQPAIAGVSMTVLHTFSQSDGGPPGGPLTEISPGVFVGLTNGEINPFDGTSLIPSTVYIVTRNGGFHLLHTFSPSVEGQGAYGPLLAASDGHLYGSSLGCNNAPATTFRLDRHGNLSVILTASATVLLSPLAEGLDLNLFGFSSSYGSPIQFFQLNSSAGYSLVSTLPNNGDFPVNEAPLLASDGRFYVSAVATGGSATVFRLSPTGAVAPVATLNDQGGPGGLMEASNGGLYGSAINSSIFTYIFRVSLGGSSAPIYTFSSLEALSDLIQASDGKLYGIGVGADLASIIFSIDPNGSNFQVVTNFEEGELAGSPIAALVQGSDGKLYGVSVGSTFGQAFSLDLGLPKPQPNIGLVQPAKVSVGSAVLIRGRYLLEPQLVTFNGTPSTSFRGISAGYVYAVVPPGATSGPVTVATPNGTTTSQQSLIIQ